MKTIEYYIPFIAVILLSAYGCNTAVDKTMNYTAKTAPVTSQSVASMATSTTTSANLLKGVKIANENDPVCDMPLLRGFEDTATYHGHLLGFCSKECKDNFLKKTTAYNLKLK